MPGLRASAPSSMRRPSGDHGVSAGAEMVERGEHLLPLGLQGVDAQVERRPARHRGRFRRAILAEHLRQIGIEPIRIVAGDRRRRILCGARGERGTLGIGQWFGREPAAVAERTDRLGIHAALDLEHAEHPRARSVVLHHPGARRAPAQHVPDQACDRRAIAGAGKAMRRAPFLQRVRRGAALGFNVVDHFDRGGQTGSRRHCKLSVGDAAIRSEAGSSMRNRATSQAARARRRTRRWNAGAARSS